MNVNSTDCQSPEVSVPPPNSTAGEMNRGVNSMPTLFICFWMISNVSARSGLPDVVVKANESLPTFGQLKMLEFPAAGLIGPAGAAVLLQQSDDVLLAELPLRANRRCSPGSNGLNTLL